MQKRPAAIRLLILALICGVVLALPGALLAAAIPAPGCPHCQLAGPGHGPCPCCQPHGKPGHCGSCGQGGILSCHFGSSGPAVLGSGFAGAPAWQAAYLLLASHTVAAKILSPDIFHPPESSFPRWS